MYRVIKQEKADQIAKFDLVADCFVDEFAVVKLNKNVRALGSLCHRRADWLSRLIRLNCSYYSFFNFIGLQRLINHIKNHQSGFFGMVLCE